MAIRAAYDCVYPAQHSTNYLNSIGNRTHENTAFNTYTDAKIQW
jgi:hypothetical protein